LILQNSSPPGIDEAAESGLGVWQFNKECVQLEEIAWDDRYVDCHVYVRRNLLHPKTVDVAVSWFGSKGQVAGIVLG